MKITVDNWPALFQYIPQVFVDDVLMDFVIEADDREGYAIIYAVDKDKNVIPTPSGHLETRRVEGRVKLVGKLQPWIQ